MATERPGAHSKAGDPVREQAEPGVQASGARAPQPRTTPSDGPSCQHCKGPLTGRKARFCSDACRMADRRQSQRARIDELLQRVEQDLAALRGVLGGEVGS